MYNLSKNILGIRVSDYLVRNTVGSIFSAGEQPQQIIQAASKLENSKIGAMITYAAEGVTYKDSKSALDLNGLIFEKGVEMSSQCKTKISAVKVSAIVPMEIIKHLTKVCHQIEQIFNQIDTTGQGWITVADLTAKLSEKSLTTEDVNEFVEKILNLKDFNENT